MKIDRSMYEGYIWYSDSAVPVVLDKKEFELEIADCANPFVVEGQLFDCTDNLSYSIRYVDGRHICIKYDLDTLKGEKSIEIFSSNRMEGRGLKFITYWKDEPDPLCEGMSVLQPREVVFVGFENRR